MTTTMQKKSLVRWVPVKPQSKPEWVPVTKAIDQLGLTRYLLKQLRLKFSLREKGTFDKRVKLIDLTEARRCLQKEIAKQVE
jgi:hypothetical protein